MVVVLSQDWVSVSHIGSAAPYVRQDAGRAGSKDPTVDPRYAANCVPENDIEERPPGFIGIVTSE